MMTSDLLTRARSVAGKHIKYKLGAGGISPQLASPASVHNECDCSGYVCWCLGISRQTDNPLYVKFNGGWINTDAIVHDAEVTTGLFSRLDRPEPGCLVVYPGPPKRKVGHVGIVTGAQAGAKGWEVTTVIHCSSGNFQSTGDAVAETPPTVFAKPDAIYAWYEGLERTHPDQG